MSTRVAPSYLRFTDVPSVSGKTRVVNVYSVRSGHLLGRISWFGRWRCYALWPTPQTVWNVGCLSEISEKIRSLMAERVIE